MLLRVFIILLAIYITSCKTSKVPATERSQPSIFGKWNYKESSGGFTGKGTGWTGTVILSLGKNMEYEVKQDLKTIESDHFRITTASFGGDSVKVLDLVNGLDQRFRLSNDTLYLDEMVNDGFSYVYVRSK